MRIKDWNKFQHYKRRNPPWIKLHKKLLDDPDWFALDGDASKMLAMCWLVASESQGLLPVISKLAFRLRRSEADVTNTLSRLSHWIETDASVLLAPCLQTATPETERFSETESETEKKDILRSANGAHDGNSSSKTQSVGTSAKGTIAKDFLEFWAEYPKKKNRKDAQKAYERARKETTHAAILSGLAEAKPNWREHKFIPYPATWLNRGAWMDEAAELGAVRSEITKGMTPEQKKAYVDEEMRKFREANRVG